MQFTPKSKYQPFLPPLPHLCFPILSWQAMEVTFQEKVVPYDLKGRAKIEKAGGGARSGAPEAGAPAPDGAAFQERKRPRVCGLRNRTASHFTLRVRSELAELRGIHIPHRPADPEIVDDDFPQS